ncbi:hypothetical protein PoB_005851700 [Plakobranchus ocellatus]|uniref:Uncharacterized protein n=1 Tax=Plakobranchus ocellatus TaxID=259542 RepID=A0AAV4CKR8_9GAST|nr:hypothetical protein PoB_005851700 [Plakobranchus ocellatus]
MSKTFPYRGRQLKKNGDFWLGCALRHRTGYEDIQRRTHPRDQTVLQRRTHPRDQTVLQRRTHPRDQTVLQRWTHPRDQTVLQRWTHPRDQTVLQRRTHPRDQTVLARQQTREWTGILRHYRKLGLFIYFDLHNSCETKTHRSRCCVGKKETRNKTQAEIGEGGDVQLDIEDDDDDNAADDDIAMNVMDSW